VIEHRANNLLKRDEDGAMFALAFLDVDNFQAHQRLLRP